MKLLEFTVRPVVVASGKKEDVFTQSFRKVQGGSNMTGTSAACLHTNQSRSYLNHLVDSSYKEVSKDADKPQYMKCKSC
jgi:hypothetical protein